MAEITSFPIETVALTAEQLRGPQGPEGPPGPKGEDGIPDAPQDGTLYGRKDGAWAPASGGVQSNWNENDPEAAAYVQNRPFYKVIPPVSVLFSKENLLFEDWGDSQGWEGEVDSSFLVPGVEHTVTLDGTTYTVVCAEKVLPSGYVWMNPHLGFAGNPEDWTPSDFPFLIQIYEDRGVSYLSMQLMGPLSGFRHSLSISAAIPKIEQINAAYIPIGAGLSVRDGVLESHPVPQIFSAEEKLTDLWWPPFEDNWGGAAVPVYQIVGHRTGGPIPSEASTDAFPDQEGADATVDVINAWGIGRVYDNHRRFIPLACYVDLGENLVYFRPAYSLSEPVTFDAVRVVVQYTKGE